MTISFQQLRSAIPGAQPSQLDPGQVAFNVSDGTMYLGTGSDVKIDFSGAQVVPAPPAGKGWIQVLLERSALDAFFLANPTSTGGAPPTNEQVLTWNSTRSEAEWQDAGTGFSYQTTDAAVSTATGATTSEKISAAIGNPGYIGQNATCIVSGNPGTTYEGLYIWNGTVWRFASHFAFNTASQVPAVNPINLLQEPTQNVLNQLKGIDDNLQTQITANSGNIATLQGQMATAQSDIVDLQINKLDIASNAPVTDYILSYDGTGQLWVPNAAGDVTSVTATAPITVDNTNPQTPVVAINAASTSAPGAVQLSSSTSSSSVTQASTPLATKTAYDLADAAVPRSSYAASGDVLVGTGIGTFGPLGVGSDGQVLTVVSGVPAWADDAPGDVTSVTATAPITVDNTDPENPVVGVDLATTATPGVVQIELTGNLTLIGGVINVPDASTTVKGAVQLNNTLSSNSTTQALTAAQGLNLQGQINALTLSNNVILAGGYDASTGLVDGATTQGIAVGFANGSAPPAPGVGNEDYYLVCVVSGSIPSAMQNGDWLLSDGTQYLVLGVGARPTSASYTQAGIVQLADAAAVVDGTSDTLAITPQALQDNVIDAVNVANSSQIASATAVKTANDNALAGQTAAAAAQATADAALPKVGGTMTGTISAQNINVQATYALQFAGGVNGTLDGVTDSVSTTDSTIAASATAVKAANDAASAAQSTANTAVSDAAAAQSTANTAVSDAAAAQATADAALPKAGGTMTGTIAARNVNIQSTYSLQFAGGANGSVDAITDATDVTSSTTAASATAVQAAYNAGTQGQTDAAAALAAANTAQATANAAVPNSAFTATGDIIYASGASTPVALAIGSAGQILTVVDGVPSWASAGPNLSGYTNNGTPFNTALGAFAGDSLTTGTNNTTIGYNAGTALTTGSRNTAMGSGALGTLTTGQSNTAVGANAGAAVTTGNNNTFLGHLAGDNVTGGSSNVAVGYNSLGAVTTSGNNVAIGVNAGAVATGQGNTFVGTSSGLAVTTGSRNLLLGYDAGRGITSGSNNTILGDFSGSSNLSNNLVLAAGTTIKLQVNENGAVGVGSTPAYGTSGQVLTSSGTGAAPAWTDVIWQNLATQTLSTTTTTTILTLPIATFRGVTINISVSNPTTANFHNDSWMVIHDGTTADAHLSAAGAHIGPSPYSLDATVSGANLLIQVTSAAASATKYVGIYQTFAI